MSQIEQHRFTNVCNSTQAICETIGTRRTAKLMRKSRETEHVNIVRKFMSLAFSFKTENKFLSQS